MISAPLMSLSSSSSSSHENRLASSIADKRPSFTIPDSILKGAVYIWVSLSFSSYSGMEALSVSSTVIKSSFIHASDRSSHGRPANPDFKEFPDSFSLNSSSLSSMIFFSSLTDRLKTSS